MTPNTYSSFRRGKAEDSVELDVFEAARYYSGQNDLRSGTNIPPHPPRTRRMSLDEHVNRSISSLHLPHGDRGKLKPSSSNIVDNGTGGHKHQHEPRSPGGRLASFLSSLFNQSNSRKKKSNKSNGSMPHSSGNVCEDPEQRRRRRSSISRFIRSSSENRAKTEPCPKSHMMATDDNNIHPIVTTPTKSHNLDLICLSDHGKVAASGKHIASIRDKMTNGSGSNIGGNDSRSPLKSSEVEEKVNDLVSGMDLYRKFTFNINDDNYKGSKECTFLEEGEESDSSSDLFELQIGSGRYCSSGLPVYETTHIERIKPGDPVN